MNSPNKAHRGALGIALMALVMVGWRVCQSPHNWEWKPSIKQIAHLELRKYDGVDLRKLPDDEREAVDRWIAHIIGSPSENGIDGIDAIVTQRWLVFFNVLMRRLYIVEMMPTVSIPGNSYCNLYIVDSSANVIRKHHFNVGYRAWPENAAFIDKNGFDGLAVETNGMWSGNTRQYYRVTDALVELIRSEDLNGGFGMGGGNLFELEEKPSDWLEWERKIMSPNETDQLRGLAEFWSYDIQDRIRSRRLNASASTAERLRQLAKSNHPWIREEASAAIQELRRYPLVGRSP